MVRRSLKSLLADAAFKVMMLVALAAALAIAAPAQAATIRYQGVLNQNGQPANGVFTMEFGVFGVQSGGTPLYLESQSVTVANGLFNVEIGLDTPLGPNLFADDQTTWLEIEVGGQTLSPRQKCVFVPYSFFALTANSLAPDGFAGTYTNELSFTNAANMYAGNGAGLTSLNAANISTGALAAARLPASGSWPISGALNIDAGTLTIDPVNDTVGVGTASPDPAMALHVAGPMRVDGPLTLAGIAVDPTTRYLSLSPGAFQPINPNFSYSRSQWEFYSSGGGLMEYTASVQLPHGAVVTGVFARVKHSAAGTHNILLRRLDSQSPTIPVRETLATCSATTVSIDWQTISQTTISLATVDNSRYSYFVQVDMTATASNTVSSVWLTYTVTSPLP